MTVLTSEICNLTFQVHVVKFLCSKHLQKNIEWVPVYFFRRLNFMTDCRICRNLIFTPERFVQRLLCVTKHNKFLQERGIILLFYARGCVAGFERTSNVLQLDLLYFCYSTSFIMAQKATTIMVLYVICTKRLTEKKALCNFFQARGKTFDDEYCASCISREAFVSVV